MKKNNSRAAFRLFDSSKSPVENAYYLLMILSVAFIVIQVIVARNSLDHSANMELTRHTVEQDNRYRVAITEKFDEFTDEILRAAYPVSMERIQEVTMWPDNLEEMTIEQAIGLNILPDSLGLTDPKEYLRLLQLQIELASELEQYAFFILNGFLFEELAYRDLGNVFLRSVNLCAVPAIYQMSYAHYNMYQITVNRYVRQLYDIWWHREQIDKRVNRIEICRSVLAGDERELGFLRQGPLEELSLGPYELNERIREAEAEIVALEKALDARLENTSVRNL
ncbi:MAG: hypothetical protein LBV38_07965 [Alistipes sp.]|nr:hypothetical protein [Alistipes sp.]